MPAEEVLPDPPALEDPPPPAVESDREVPASDVLALEEMLPDALLLDNTLPPALAVKDDASAEVEFTLLSAEVVLLDDRADVAEEGVERPAVEEGVNSVFALAAVPAPAPEDEPAVCDTAVEEVALVAEDWM